MTFLPLRFVPIAPPGFPNFEFAIWDESVLISETKLTDTYYSIFLFFTKKIVFQNDEQAEVRWKQWEQWEEKVFKYSTSLITFPMTLWLETRTAFKKLVTLESTETSKNKNQHLQTLP